MIVGRVAGLRRYPVKSMQGLEVDRVVAGPDGVEGDRHRACIDEGTGRIMSAKRFGQLLQASADDEGITLPRGRRLVYGADEVDQVLSGWMGRRGRLGGRGPATQRSYEMTFDPPNDDAEYYEIPSPAGSYLDLAGIHLLTTATLAGGQAAA